MLPEAPETRLMALFKELRNLPLMRLPAGFPLSQPQISLLNWVALSPGVGVLDIAHSLDVTPPTVSVAVRRLCDEGLLESQQDPDDRRVRRLYLTNAGQDMVAQVWEHRTQAMKAFLAGLTPEEQLQLTELFERAVQALKQSLGED